MKAFVSVTLKDQMKDRAAELSAAEEANEAEEDADDVEDVEDNFDTDEE